MNPPYRSRNRSLRSRRGAHGSSSIRPLPRRVPCGWSYGRPVRSSDDRVRRPRADGARKAVNRYIHHLVHFIAGALALGLAVWLPSCQSPGRKPRRPVAVVRPTPPATATAQSAPRRAPPAWLPAKALACDAAWGEEPERAERTGRRVELDCGSAWHSHMLAPRRDPLAVRLRGGDLLVVGGTDQGAMPMSERYDVEQQKWTALAGPIGYLRWSPAARPAQALVPHGDGALFVQMLGGELVVAELDDGGVWVQRPRPPIDRTAAWVDHVALAQLTDDVVMLAAWNTVALFEGGDWRSHPAPHLGGHIAMLTALEGGECWGDRDFGIFEPSTGRLLSTPPMLNVEHSIDPWLVVAGGDPGGTARIMVTSEFGNSEEGMVVELCSIGSVSNKMPRCGCTGCTIPARDDYAAVADGRGCMIVIGGKLATDSRPLDEVIRLCWPR